LEAAWLVGSQLGCHATSHDTRELQPKVRAPRYAKQLLFNTLIRQIVYGTPDYLVFHFLCDNDQEVAPGFYKGVEHFKRVDKAYARRIAGVCFYDDVKLPVLQAADMVAYVDRDRRAGRQNLLASILFKGSSLDDVTYPYVPPASGGERPPKP
jgi:hypothetical protein